MGERRFRLSCRRFTRGRAPRPSRALTPTHTLRMPGGRRRTFPASVPLRPLPNPGAGLGGERRVAQGRGRDRAESVHARFLGEVSDKGRAPAGENAVGDPWARPAVGQGSGAAGEIGSATLFRPPRLALSCKRLLGALGVRRKPTCLRRDGGWGWRNLLT